MKNFCFTSFNNWQRFQLRPAWPTVWVRFLWTPYGLTFSSCFDCSHICPLKIFPRSSRSIYTLVECWSINISARPNVRWHAVHSLYSISYVCQHLQIAHKWNTSARDFYSDRWFLYFHSAQKRVKIFFFSGFILKRYSVDVKISSIHVRSISCACVRY
jgi:hypothetical protein